MQSGGGQQGGGQKSKQEGKGSAGSKTPSDDKDGQASKEKGPGDIGDTPGKDAESKQPTEKGESKKAKSGQETGETQPGGDEADAKQSNDDSPGGEAGKNPPPGGDPTRKSQEGSNTAPGSGNPTVGGNPDHQPEAKQRSSEEPGGDEANLEYARMRTELALRHLDEEASKDKSELLDRMGWSKEDAKRFLDRWKQLEREARDSGPKGKEAKKELDDALKSLGLRPRSTQIGRGSTSPDRDRNLRDRGRFAPPAEWAEQFREYQRGGSDSKK
jgi:hypothetical protein